MVKRGRMIAFFLLVLLFAGIIGTTTESVTKGIPLGLDLQGGFEILYEVEPLDDDQEINDEAMDATVQSLRERVDILGINETNIQIEGDNRIRVQLAGIQDQKEARDLLSTTATLSFRDVNDKLYLDGSDIVEGSAKQDFHPRTGEPVVTLRLKDPDKFAEVTSTIKNFPEPENVLVIWLDYEEGDSYKEERLKENPKYISAPAVNETIRSNVMITGPPFTVDSAKRLADILNAGSLPVKLTEIYSISVGAQFGEKALDQTVFAGIIGIALIFIYMIIYYRLPGLIASITLSVYVYVILLVFNLMNGVLTLPGIAALVLGVGMAVDANIITYERIKEELKAGKTVLSAYRAGNKRSLATILDANITTILAAVVLFIFGTSSVKGFATMLIVSILVSFITAVYGTRLLMGLWVKSGLLNHKPGYFGVKKEAIKDITKGEEVEATFFGKTFNFVKHSKKFFAISAVLIAAGIVSLFTLQLNLGIDFTSGSRVQVMADNTLDIEEVRDGYESLGLNPVEIVSAGDQGELAIARFDRVLNQEEIAEIGEHFSAQYGNEPSVSTVTPKVGRELAFNAVQAVLYASIGIIIYVAFRFEIFFAVTAILALLHDAFFILALFSLTQLEFDITIIAAILTIVGYSVNDTIVTFDRIRENLRFKKRVKSYKELAAVVNKSLMETLARSINTVLTVIFAAFMLFMFGAEAITNFSFALIVGLLAGTYSSLFIAAQLWLVWRGRMLDKKPIVFERKKPKGGPQV
ncbi:protein translocase subunit secF /protein translocase subunit secD [Melghiribacillus thermohalophilus]|uniref:Multifunctional fusion protein n=1 Tax=Melghiribacillus thermohalophilus TaxID=1324956 RepID=A0A4R3NHY6_9BACI|nr:protein translocase subunit SecDF [Melghiribacillus thermohalophilus]TCT27098.1 protein translocase subunit secF /protein translocase subunit secD [Melghiribacillus thermohalophilus]